MYLASFAKIFLMTFQVQNIQHHDILLAGITSVFMSLAFMITVNGIVNGSWKLKAAFTVGAAMGVMSAIWIGTAYYN